MNRRICVTTAGRPDELSLSLARKAAGQLGCPFEERRKRSVRKMSEALDADLLVAGKGGYALHRKGSPDAPLFFHPDTAAFRLKRLMRGGMDPLVSAGRLEAGDRFLDCTLGLATDCLVASFVIGGTGSAAGIEADPAVAFITREGLERYEAKFPELEEAMRRISVVQGRAEEVLCGLEDRSYDVVYVDPMFSAIIEESGSFAPLRAVGLHGGLTERWLREARRVCRKRIVLKAHFSDPAFETYGFTRIHRPNTKFHYGYLEMETPAGPM